MIIDLCLKKYKVNLKDFKLTFRHPIDLTRSRKALIVSINVIENIVDSGRTVNGSKNISKPLGCPDEPQSK